MNTLKTKQMEIDLTSSDLVQAHMSDWKTVADITGEAFAEDPVNQWVFGKPGAIRSMFRIMAREMYLPQGLSHLHPAGGATMWMPPGVDAAPSQVGLFKFALGQLRHGTLGAIKRGMALSDLMQAWHPKEPHMYLFTIGTTRDARGKGVGKGLLAPVLKACDAAGLPVYLENSNPANSGFYATHGFERMGVFEIGGDGSPIMEPMWREAKT
jgi:ribosomal protein S18 acetylase RimI-like enzyme